MMATQKASLALPDRLQAAAILTLWRSGQFDTADIAVLLSLPEAEVSNLLHRARVVERQMAGLRA